LNNLLRSTFSIGSGTLVLLWLDCCS